MSITAVPRAPFRRNQVAVNSHMIALGDESLELDAQIWVLARDPFHKTNERLRAVTGHGVVLAIRRPDVPPHGFLGLSLAMHPLLNCQTLHMLVVMNTIGCDHHAGHRERLRRCPRRRRTSRGFPVSLGMRFS